MAALLALVIGMSGKTSRFQRLRRNAQAIWEERGFDAGGEVSKLQKFAHFWVLVWKSFARNRCPVRASALAYATLLALIPMLAVVVSITSTFLKQEGEDQIDHFIIKFVASVVPPDMEGTNAPQAQPELSQPSQQNTNSSFATNASSARAGIASDTDIFGDEDEEMEPPANYTNKANTLAAFAQQEPVVRTRKVVARRIHQFIQNTRSGALGLTGSILLIFAAISMLSRIEVTFNDIWGVERGRGWFTRIVLYWGVLSLAPLLVVVALGLGSGPHLEGPKKLLTTMPFVGHFIFQFVPIIVLCLTFGVFYMLMPNTKVDWRAALTGGFVGGVLFHINNLASVFYVSRLVSNSKIYGSLALVPVFMIGLYFGWLILLFGAQVAYAYQNRSTYLEERQVENVNQRGREFIALRLMTRIGQYYLRGEPPPGIAQISRELCIPSRLSQQVLQTLASARLVVETAGPEPSFVPARPIDHITCHDILMAMRATRGQELSTREEPERNEVYGEFHRIQEAERKAAAAVTMLAMVSRAQTEVGEHQLKAPEKEN
jgi:membrane protein